MWLMCLFVVDGIKEPEDQLLMPGLSGTEDANSDTRFGACGKEFRTSLKTIRFVAID